MKKTFEAHSIKQCLELASKELNVSEENLKYNVLKEKGIFLSKKFIVEIEVEDKFINLEEKNLSTSSESENIGDNIKSAELINCGSVKIKNGNIEIKNPKDGAKPATIIAGEGVFLKVNGVEVKGRKEVFEESVIEVFFEESKPFRELKINVSEEKIEAYCTIKYESKKIYGLKDKEENLNLILEKQVVSEVKPPKYTVDEIRNELTKNNIVYGIIEENLKQCVEVSEKEILIAKGKQVIHGENDFVEMNFKTEEHFKKLKEDNKGNVDFKSIGAVGSVKKGDILAVRKSGTPGQDGIDVYGKVKRHKLGKRLKLKAGEGCIINDEDTIVALIDGKPSVRSNCFYVHKIHEVRSNVDIKTGNIKFMGDIIVYGSVTEGMEVECGHFLTIEKDIERANIKAKSDINIKGNVIAAKVFGGGEDVNKIKTLKDLEDLKEQLENLVGAVEEIKRYSLLGPDKRDGEIIKILIENKFKLLIRLCISVISDLNMQKDDYNEEVLVTLIREKLIGIAPINIKHFSELQQIIEIMSEKILIIKKELDLPVNVKFSYCQDSSIQSSGDIIVTGKGEYISEIMANGSIYFLQENSVARGGYLKAKNEIKCRIVGSIAGVSTKLHVDKKGEIWADVAYQNTIFAIGNREFVLDVPSKQIHAYIDKNDELIVDKFML